jgi:hypothetical protein
VRDARYQGLYARAKYQQFQLELTLQAALLPVGELLGPVIGAGLARGGAFVGRLGSGLIPRGIAGLGRAALTEAELSCVVGCGVGPAAGGLSGAGLRTAIEAELGESLAGQEFSLHGTTAEIAENFELQAGKALFATTEPSVARLFAERTIAKLGAGEVGGVALVLPRAVVGRLRSLGLLTVRSIGDMPNVIEWVFSPGAREILLREGEIVVLPPGAL